MPCSPAPARVGSGHRGAVARACPVTTYSFWPYAAGCCNLPAPETRPRPGKRAGLFIEQRANIPCHSYIPGRSLTFEHTIRSSRTIVLSLISHGPWCLAPCSVGYYAGVSRGYTSSGTQGHTTALNDCVPGRSLLYPTVISRDLLCVLCRLSTRIHVMCGRYSGYRRPRLAMVLHTMHRLWIIGDASQRARAPARFAGRCLSTACQTRVRKGNDSASTAPAASTACLLHSERLHTSGRALDAPLFSCIAGRASGKIRARV